MFQSAQNSLTCGDTLMQQT